MIRLERVLEILAPHLKATAADNGTEIVVTFAERVGNKWEVTDNTIEFAENGNHLDSLVGNRPLQVDDDGLVTGVDAPPALPRDRRLD
jgi:hypothetical protein